MLRIGIFQGPLEAGPASTMLAALNEAAAAAARKNVTLLVMPELFLTGYNIGGAALRERAEEVDGPSALAAAEIARKNGIALVYGYPERASNGRLYNSALAIGRDGRNLANFRKMHLFGAMETEIFTPGDDPLVLAEIEGVRTGVLICYDVEFPEAVRCLSLAGADLVVVPTALMHPYDFVPAVLVRARAWENQVFLAYANRCGNEGEMVYTGQSCIIGPDGSELARAGEGAELIDAALDPALLAQSRQLNTYLRDRRPALYGTLSAVAP